MSEEPETKRKKVVHRGQVMIYDFTFFGKAGSDGPPTVERFVELLQPIFKKWVFQLEACPTTGRLHYQGRGSLFKQKRQPELCAMLNETDLRGMDVSESSNNSKQFEVFYSLKHDTRVEGPWCDRSWIKPAYVPRQFRGLIDRLYPFQKSILDTRLDFNDRQVNVLYDPTGCNGKSTMASLAELHFKGLDLPPIGDHKELCQVVCDILMARQQRDPGIVFVDLPRTLTLEPKKLAPFMVAIEQIKKGHVCDVRHHYRDWWFDSPAVWVCCNHMPDVRYMSRDRWRFWTITGLKTLREMTRCEVENLGDIGEV